MRHLRQVVLAGLTLTVVIASAASAQRPATRSRSASSSANVWELGFDAALSFGLDNPRVTTLSIPVGNFRAGIFTSDVLEIEPFFSYNYTKIEGFSSVSAYQVGAGALYHFSADRTRSQVYVRPFVALVGASAGGNSNSDVGIGVGLGMKWPKMNGRIAWRGEGNVSTTGDATAINLLWGLSFFTR